MGKQRPSTPTLPGEGLKSSVEKLEMAFRESQSMSVSCRLHPLAALRPYLAKRGLITAGDLKKLSSGDIVRVAGLTIIVHTPPTRSGRRIMFITMEDETGLMDLVVFPELQKQAAKEVLTSEVLAVEGQLKREGAGGRSISITAQRIIPEFSGPLAELLKKFV